MRQRLTVNEQTMRATALVWAACQRLPATAATYFVQHHAAWVDAVANALAVRADLTSLDVAQLRPGVAPSAPVPPVTRDAAPPTPRRPSVEPLAIVPVGLANIGRH